GNQFDLETGRQSAPGASADIRLASAAQTAAFYIDIIGHFATFLLEIRLEVRLKSPRCSDARWKSIIHSVTSRGRCSMTYILIVAGTALALCGLALLIIKRENATT